MPPGDEVTVPLPTRLMVSAYCARVKVAVTFVAANRVTVHVPVPVQPPPLQPVKIEFTAAAAVSVTTVPLE